MDEHQLRCSSRLLHKGTRLWLRLLLLTFSTRLLQFYVMLLIGSRKQFVAGYMHGFCSALPGRRVLGLRGDSAVAARVPRAIAGRSIGAQTTRVSAASIES